MWLATLTAWLGSIPTLIIILFCIQDFDGIVSASYSNNWAEYLVQLIGPKGAVAILSLLWVDSTCATASCFLSAQRVTFAISRDGVLPFSSFFRKLNKNKIPVNAAYLVMGMSVSLRLPFYHSVCFTKIRYAGCYHVCGHWVHSCFQCHHCYRYYCDELLVSDPYRCPVHGRAEELCTSKVEPWEAFSVSRTRLHSLHHVPLRGSAASPAIPSHCSRSLDSYTVECTLTDAGISQLRPYLHRHREYNITCWLDPAIWPGW